MAVRKRKWVTKSGEAREAWVVDYVDQKGERHIETFEKKRDADIRHDAVRTDVRKGIHTAINRSITVEQAAKQWLKHVEAEGVERTTVDQYEGHVRLHILPRIGGEKLAVLTAPRMESLRDELLRDLGRAMGRKVLTSIKAILKDAHRRGFTAQNVAAGVVIKKDKRAENHRPQVGIDIPLPAEIQSIIGAAKGRWKPLIITAAFSGLRASELRGLRWEDIDFKTSEISIRQRADIHNELGKPKSEAGVRTFPLRSIVIKTLREWKIACPPGELVFPNKSGNIENLSNILQRGFHPAQLAAGVTVTAKDDDGKVVRDDDGKPVVAPKYYGLHTLRHFFASLCINRRANGGLELPPKTVQTWLGHSTITLTLDTYGHLFPEAGDVAEVVTDLERALS
jgi:integrase